MLLSSAALVTASNPRGHSSSKRCSLLFAVFSARSTSNLAFVSVSMALISMSSSTRGFFVTLSRVSALSSRLDESCNFGAISWLEELTDGVSHNFARFASVSLSSVTSESARLTSCLCVNRTSFGSLSSSLSSCSRRFNNFPSASNFHGRTVCRQSNVCFRPRLTLIPC